MGSWGVTNNWECLSTWRCTWSPHLAWGHEQCDGDLQQTLTDDVYYSHGDLVHVDNQGLQPYVNVGGYHDTPFPCEFNGRYGIDIGVDQDFSVLFQPRVGMSHAHVDPVDDGHMEASHEPAILSAMTEEIRAGQSG